MLLTENISALHGCADCPEIGIIKAVHILKRVLLFSCCLFAVFPAADELRYRAHRAINDQERGLNSSSVMIPRMLEVSMML